MDEQLKAALKKAVLNHEIPEVLDFIVATIEAESERLMTADTRKLVSIPKTVGDLARALTGRKNADWAYWEKVGLGIGPAAAHARRCRDEL